MFKNFLLIPNPEKTNSLEFAVSVADYLVSNGKKAFVEDKYAQFLPKTDNISYIDEKTLSTVDMAVVLGGDGTVLRNIGFIKHYEIPVFGINFGHLGYLTQCEPKDAFEYLDRVFKNEFEIENRIMFKTCIEGNTNALFTGINEAVIHRGLCPRALHISVNVNNNPVESFYADGVLVATPTGSTAYNMSAGGPVVIPTANNFVITPICAHSMCDCSVVVSGDDEIDITISPRLGETSCENACLTIDGIHSCDFSVGEKLNIKKSNYNFKLAKFNNDSFYQTLKHKLSKTL